MIYEFLHHLTQATLPLVIYEPRLAEQLNAYEFKRLLIIARPKSSLCVKIDLEKGVQVLKITRAGRRAVHRHLQASQCLGEKSISN